VPLMRSSGVPAVHNLHCTSHVIYNPLFFSTAAKLIVDRSVPIMVAMKSWSAANSKRRWKTATPIGMRNTSRVLLVTKLTTAYVGLLGGRGLMVAQDHGNSYSPRSRKASGLGVVLCAGRLNVANRAPQEQHRT